MSRAQNYFAWLHSLVEPHLGRRVLEVGSGLGNFTQLLLDRDLVVGIDSEPDCVASRSRRFAGHTNVVSLQQDVLAPGFLDLGRVYEPDSIACLNVLEHVPDDAAALRSMHAVLPAGGRAVLIVPAFDALYGPTDRNLGHYRRYTKQSFAAIARGAGFAVDRLRYFNVCGFVAWWFNARVLRLGENSAGQIAVFDALIAPIFSKLERLTDPPAGQSLLAVLHKSPESR